MAERLTLEQCRSGRLLSRLPGGLYRLEYNDSTHLGPNEWVLLATIEVSATSAVLADNEYEQFFAFRPDIGDAPQGQGQGQGQGQNAAEAGRRRRTIEDTLALALGRVGLLGPTVPADLLKEVEEMRAGDGVIIVPDTNALHNGAVHWLLRVLGRSSVWLLPLSASLTSVQQRDATVKNMVGKKKATNLVQALRSRGLVNGALGLLQRHRGRSQVVEIDHSLLRYLPPAAKDGADPDQSDVIEDRLIIEAIHGVLRTMRSRTARRVVTSDVNLARVLEAEGVQVLFVPTIILGDQPIDCIRYDALARGFCGAPLSSVLWEIAHAFGSVRLAAGESPVAILDCYWAGKTPAEWSSETLTCTFDVPALPEGEAPAPENAEAGGENDVAEAAVDQGVAEVAGNDPARPTDAVAPGGVPSADRGLSAAEPRGVEATAEDDVGIVSSDVGRTGGVGTDGTPLSEAMDDRARPQPASRRRDPATTPSNGGRAAVGAGAAREQPITAVLPRASFPQILRLLGILRRHGPQTADDAARHAGGGVTADTLRRAFEILQRTGLSEQDGGRFRAIADSQIVDNALASDDLDAASAIMLRFAPYRTLADVLREAGRVRRSDVHGLLSERLGTVGSYEAYRLPRFLTLLGQAWTDGDDVVYGGERPPDRDAGEFFASAFGATAAGGVAKVIDLLTRFCELSGMSPWAAKRQLERIVAERLLPEYRFEPSAGGKPVTRDEVLAGTLDAVVIRPVIIDRLHLGERPVFVVEARAR